jgi:hypothetical protein
MSTWEELERRFMQLAPEAHGMELHFQTGEALRYWLSDGGQQARARFEVLAKEAGIKVLELPPSVLHDLARLRRDPVERWYEAMRQQSGYFRIGAHVEHRPRDGVVRPSRFGAIRQPCEASCTLAQQFASATAQMPTTQRRGGIEGWLRHQKERHGTTWAVVMGVVAVIGIASHLPACTPQSAGSVQTMAPASNTSHTPQQ